MNSYLLQFSYAEDKPRIREYAKAHHISMNKAVKEYEKCIHDIRKIRYPYKTVRDSWLEAVHDPTIQLGFYAGLVTCNHTIL